MFNNNLRDAREELEMTQTKLGLILGVAKQTISGWETGRDPIPFNLLIKFCNLYNFSLDYIVGFKNRNVSLKQFKIDKYSIGINLHNFRKSLKLSQQEFSDKCKISQSTYAGYEIGRYLITTTNLYIICKTYNISMDYLCGRTDNKNIK